MTRQAILLEQGKASAHRAVGRQLRVGQKHRKTRFDGGLLANRGNLERPLLRADTAGLRCSPHQVERSCTRLALAQWWPWPVRFLHRQPGLCRPLLQQWRRGHFGGKTVQRHCLQVVAGAHAVQQRGQRHSPITHGLLVGNVLVDADVPGLRVVEQFFTAPLARRSAQFKVQLRRRQRQAQEQH